MLSIISFVLGLVETNTYLIADPETGEAVVIDPAGDGARIVAEADRRGWRVGSIWLTHAHFDHLAGAGEVADRLDPTPPVALPLRDLASSPSLFTHSAMTTDGLLYRYRGRDPQHPDNVGLRLAMTQPFMAAVSQNLPLLTRSRRRWLVVSSALALFARRWHRHSLSGVGDDPVCRGQRAFVPVRRIRWCGDKTSEKPSPWEQRR